MKKEQKFTARLASLARHVALELITTVLPAVIVALLVNVYVAEAVTIEEGPSMQPNLYRGDRLMTEKISYLFHPPQRGDVVIVERPGNEKTLVKRVIAVAGEVVEVRKGHALINGQPVEEPWVTHFGGPDYGPIVVPAEHVFILGDNRAVSRDSRAIGPVLEDAVRGRVWLVYWPPGQVKSVPSGARSPW
jgi:signal peptidase I